MTSKERVRAVMMHQKPDRVPAAFHATERVYENLLAHYGFDNVAQLYEKYEIDIIPADAKYIGKPLAHYIDEQGRQVNETFWGFHLAKHETDVESYNVTVKHPLEGVETMEDLDAYTYPSADDFDYSPITRTCEENPDKAIIIGHPGPFQMVTNLMSMEEFFILMLEEEEVAHAILDRMVDFEVAYYERCFIAGGGKIDVLRPHDDYGTQISLLFSTDLWQEFFAENTRRLTELCHKYGVFYQQHSCGAVGPLIPHFIECGVDALEPVQKVQSLEIENLVPYCGKITFHGGVDTQDLLPHGTAQEVAAETERFIKALGADGNYMLMASQAFEPDVPVENIEAVYSVNRVI